MLTMVAVPSSTVAETNSLDEIVEFSFLGEQGQLYEISNVAGRASGFTFYRNGDRVGSDVTTHHYVAAEDGVITIEVKPRVPGDFLFQLEAVEYLDDYGNLPELATPLSPEETTGSIEVAGDVDFFSFDVTAGFTHSLELSGDFLAKIEVFDSNQNRISSFSTRKSFSWTPLESGPAFVAVFGGDEAYELRLQEFLDPGDHGSITSLATAVSLPASIRAEIDHQGDADVFAFEAVADGLYGFFVDESDERVQLTVYDTDGTTRIAADSESLIWTAPDNGTYFLSATGSRQSYRLNMEVAIESEPPTTISFPDEFLVEFDETIAPDEYAFEATTDNIYTFSAWWGTASRSLTLVAPDRTTVLARDSRELRWVVPTDGTYFLQINEPYDSYRLTADVESRTDDYGDRFDLATPVDVGSSINGEIEVNDDADYFSFQATEGIAYNVFTPFLSPLRPDLTLYGTDGETVLARSASAARFGGSSFVNWVAPATGTYYVGFRDHFEVGSANTPGSYELRIETYADDHGDGIAEATLVSGTSESIEGIYVSEDVDVFAFEPQVGGRYRIEVDPLFQDSLFFIDFEFVNSAGESRSVAPTGTVWEAQNDETIYVSISGRGGYEGRVEYAFSIEPVPSCEYFEGNGCDFEDLDFALWEQRNESHDVAIANVQGWLDEASDPMNSFKATELDRYVLGDLNLDGRVDSVDLGALLNNFGPGNGLFIGWERGDVNGDRVVDSRDLGVLLNNFGFRSPEVGVAAMEEDPGPVVSVSFELREDDEG